MPYVNHFVVHLANKIYERFCVIRISIATVAGQQRSADVHEPALPWSIDTGKRGHGNGSVSRDLTAFDVDPRFAPSLPENRSASRLVSK